MAGAEQPLALTLREGLRTGVQVAQPPIEGEQLGPQVDDQDLDLPAAACAQALLGGGHEAPAEPPALPGRSHGEQTEVPPGTAELDVDAAGQAARLVGEQEAAGLEVLADV